MAEHFEEDREVSGAPEDAVPEEALPAPLSPSEEGGGSPSQDGETEGEITPSAPEDAERHPERSEAEPKEPPPSAEAPEDDAPDAATFDDEDDEDVSFAPIIIAIAVLLIAALVIVLFVAPGFLRRRSAGSSESFSSAPPESVAPSSSYSSPSSSPAYSAVDEIPDFVLYGVTPYLMEEGEPYSYMTEDIDEEGIALVGVITARSYIRGELSKTAQAFAADMELDLTGYESCSVTFEIAFEDGYPDMGYFCTDYYNAAAFEDEFDCIGSSPDGDYEYYAGHVIVAGDASHVTTGGAKRNVYLLLHLDYDYEGAFLAVENWEVLVPEGYDGICIGYYNTMLEQSEDYQNAQTVLDCFDRDNMFFFRCD